jgi:hypothetical protein
MFYRFVAEVPLRWADVEHYLQHGRLEQQGYDQSVTDWELIRLFERI